MKEYIVQANAPETIACFDAHNAPELVRCKYCEMDNQCSIQFKFADADNPGDWYCADGRRKDDK